MDQHVWQLCSCLILVYAGACEARCLVLRPYRCCRKAKLWIAWLCSQLRSSLGMAARDSFDMSRRKTAACASRGGVERKEAPRSEWEFWSFVALEPGTCDWDGSCLKDV